jgi:hypothetical protein
MTKTTSSKIKNGVATIVAIIVAIMARQRLGGNASVRIKTAAGQTIAGN